MHASIAPNVTAPRESVLKKGFVILLLALAVIVLVSPALVGRLAEESMDENLDWAATESRDLTITSQGFERGWFSSEGQHRVELRDGDVRDALLLVAVNTDFDGLPALVIDTHIDHGLVAVTSMAREKGTLLPGLGSAVSTMHLEFENGETVDIPGTIYSEVGLSGELQSNFILEPGTFSNAGETAQWGNVDVLITTSPSTDIIGFSGDIDEIAFVSSNSEVTIGPLRFEGDQRKTRFGPYVGDAAFTIDRITMPSSFGQDSMGPISFTSTVAIDDSALSGRTTVVLDDLPFGDFGRARISMDISVVGLADCFERFENGVGAFAFEVGEPIETAVILERFHAPGAHRFFPCLCVPAERHNWLGSRQKGTLVSPGRRRCRRLRDPIPTMTRHRRRCRDNPSGQG